MAIITDWNYPPDRFVPCPFCKRDKAELMCWMQFGVATKFRYKCLSKNCKATTKYCDTIEDALTEWNKGKKEEQ